MVRIKEFDDIQKEIKELQEEISLTNIERDIPRKQKKRVKKTNKIEQK